MSKYAAEVFDSMEQRPAMYWGDFKTPFASLVAFVNGHDMAIKMENAEQLVPHGFHDYVAKHYGHESPGAKGWMTFIRENSNSEEEAFTTFFELIREFHKARGL